MAAILCKVEANKTEFSSIFTKEYKVYLKINNSKVNAPNSPWKFFVVNESSAFITVRELFEDPIVKW